MNQLSQNFSVFSLALIVSLPGIAGAVTTFPGATESKINVRIYNHAQVRDSSLNRSEREASRILREAGIESKWLGCLQSLPEPHQLPACQEPYGPMDFVIRILAQRGLARAGFRDSHMGFALPSEQGGVHACIFYPVVEEWAQGGVTREQILGHALAHEIGHLLLSSNLHFPAGLMQAKWGPGELHRVARGDLLFTREQVQTMRHELDRRVLRHHEAGDSAIRFADASTIQSSPIEKQFCLPCPETEPK